MDARFKLEAMARALYVVGEDPFTEWEDAPRHVRVAYRAEAEELLSELDRQLEYSDRWRVIEE